jgi:hypothetical protein
MAVLTVGAGQTYTTIESAVQASSPGDTIDVNADTYNDDFVSINQSLALQAVGGEVFMTADKNAPDGKAIITEGNPGQSVTINGFDISGAQVNDQNGAAIRYQGGNLSLSQDDFHNNQEGILGAPDPNGSISIDDSEFAFNGNGQGNTHNLYIGAIASFSITNSYIHDAIVGHEIKSRAANNTIENNRIFDNNGSASYSIDLPNGGNATITGNEIQQGPNTQNPFIIAYGEEGASNPGTAVSIVSNTIVNDDSRGAGILNPAETPLGFTDNQVWGLTVAQLPSGSGNVILTSRPSLDTSSLSFINPPAGSPPPPPSQDPTPPPSPPPTEPPSPAPTPVITAADFAAWQQLVATDWVAYVAANPAVLQDPVAITALGVEITDPLCGTAGIPAACVWGPFS